MASRWHPRTGNEPDITALFKLPADRVDLDAEPDHVIVGDGRNGALRYYGPFG
jgi:hypothetical protein